MFLPAQHIGGVIGKVSQIRHRWAALAGVHWCTRLWVICGWLCKCWCAFCRVPPTIPCLWVAWNFHYFHELLIITTRLRSWQLFVLNQTICWRYLTPVQIIVMSRFLIGSMEVMWLKTTINHIDKISACGLWVTKAPNRPTSPNWMPG